MANNSDWKPMPPPSIDQLAPDPGGYMTALCAESGMSQAAVGSVIGLEPRTMRRHLNGSNKLDAKLYATQYVIESLVGAGITRRVRRQFGMRMPGMPR